MADELSASEKTFMDIMNTSDIKPEVKPDEKTEIIEKPEEQPVANKFYPGESLAGEFDSAEKLNEYITKTKEDLTNLRQVSETFESEKSTWEKTLSDARKKNSYSDPDLYRLNHIKVNDPDKYDLAKKIVFDGVSDKEALRLQWRTNNPSMNDVPDDKVDKLIARDFKLSHSLKPLTGTNDGDDWTSEEIDARKKEIELADDEAYYEGLRYKTKAADALKDLKKVFEGIEIPEVQSEEDKVKAETERTTELGKKWTNDFQTIQTDMSKYTVELDGQPFLDIPIKPEQVKDIMTEVGQLILQENIEPTKENVQIVKDHAMQEFVKDNFKDILKGAVTKARKLNEDEWNKFVYNAKPDVNPAEVEVKAPIKTNEDVVNAILAGK